MSDTKYKSIKIGLIDLKSHNLFSILQATRNVGYNVKIIEHYKRDFKKRCDYNSRCRLIQTRYESF